MFYIHAVRLFWANVYCGLVKFKKNTCQLLSLGSNWPNGILAGYFFKAVYILQINGQLLSIDRNWQNLAFTVSKHISSRWIGITHVTPAFDHLSRITYLYLTYRSLNLHLCVGSSTFCRGRFWRQTSRLLIRRNFVFNSKSRPASSVFPPSVAAVTVSKDGHDAHSDCESGNWGCSFWVLLVTCFKVFFFLDFCASFYVSW